MVIQCLLADQHFNGVVHHLIGKHLAVNHIDVLLYIRQRIYIDDQL